MRVAILGATGHIGTALAHHYAADGETSLDLYARRPDAVSSLLPTAAPGRVRVLPLDGFDFAGVDVVVNALGAGDPSRVRAIAPNIVALTLDWEDLIRRALARSGGDPLYVFLSSGAVYGRLIEDGARIDARTCFSVNTPREDEAYGLAKFLAEAIHRSETGRRILDVRIFGFVSRHIDLGGKYFLSELFDALAGDKTFVTGAQDMIRDYVDADDLAALIGCASRAVSVNMAADIYSQRPAGKFEIIQRLAEVGLKCRVDPDYPHAGQRIAYASHYDVAGGLGYVPARAAVDTVERVARQIIDDRDQKQMGGGAR